MPSKWVGARTAFVVAWIALSLAWLPMHSSAALPRARGGVGAATPRDAYYVLLHTDLSSPSWPQAFVNYSVLVVQPLHFTAQDMLRVRQALPGAKFLAYFDSMHVPIKSGCSTGDPMGDKPGRLYPGDGPYYQQLRAAFDVKWSAQRTDVAPGDNTTVCTYPGLAAWVPFEDSVNGVVDFHKKVTFCCGLYDGLYMDNQVKSGAGAARAITQDGSVAVDTNGDGKPDSMDAIAAQWEEWRPKYTAAIRAAMVDARAGQSVGATPTILLGNSAGALGDPSLNGITIEMESCQNATLCDAALAGQQAVAAKPDVSVMWLTHAEVVPPAEQCARVKAAQAKFPYLLAGTDFFDGSHVVC